MDDRIYIGEALKISGIKDRRTFDKYVKKGIFKIEGTDPLGHRFFSRKKVAKVAPLVNKERKKGYPLILSTKGR